MMRTLQIYFEIFHFYNNIQEIAIITLNVELFEIIILKRIAQRLKMIKK